MRSPGTRARLCGALLLGSVMIGCEREPPDPLEVRVVGQDFEWHFRYPGADGRLDTEDDVLGRRDLHVPVGRPVEVQLQSTDYVYGFVIPDLSVSEMAAPNIPFRAHFQAGAVGALELRGDGMCGYPHESLLGRLVVHTGRDFERWLREQ